MYTSFFTATAFQWSLYIYVDKEMDSRVNVLSQSCYKIKILLSHYELMQKVCMKVQGSFFNPKPRGNITPAQQCIPCMHDDCRNSEPCKRESNMAQLAQVESS